jgi:hypothetical protein
MLHILVLARESTPALRQLRTTQEARVLLTETLLWLSLPSEMETATIPALERYSSENLTPGALLTLTGHRVPTRRLPEGEWLTIPAAVSTVAPQFAAPTSPPLPISWSLIPCTTPRQAILLKCSFEKFCVWRSTAPAVRRNRLQHAANDRGTALVCGTPLPPLLGEIYWAEGHFFLPAGWKLPNGVTSQLAARALSLGDHDLALLERDGSLTILTGELWESV